MAPSPRVGLSFTFKADPSGSERQNNFPTRYLLLEAAVLPRKVFWPSLFACLFDDERVPCYRPRDDVVRQLLDHPEEQLNKHGRGAGVEDVLTLLSSSFLSAFAHLFIFVVVAHLPGSMTRVLQGCGQIGVSKPSIYHTTVGERRRRFRQR